MLCLVSPESRVPRDHPLRAIRRLADEALDALLAKVRSELPEACDKEDADTLVRILCTGTMRVGVRWNYPMFSTLVGDTDERIGYDTAVARYLDCGLFESGYAVTD